MIRLDTAGGRTWLALGMGVLFSLLFCGLPFGVSVPLAAAASLASAGLAAWSSGKRPAPSQWLVAGAAVVFSLFFALRCAPELSALNLALTVYLTFLAVSPWPEGRALEEFSAGDYAAVPPALLSSSFRKGREEFGRLGERVEGLQLPVERIARGLVVALPVLFLLGLLMQSADQVFDALTRRVFGSLAERAPLHLGRFVTTACVATVFAGLYAWVRSEGPKPAAEGGWLKLVAGGSEKWSFVESAAAMGAVNLLFAAFAAVQGLFLLGGRKTIESLGVTYSDYARQGFWQLVAIGVIVFVLSLVLEEKVERTTARQKAIHKANLVLASAMTGLMMLSAFERLSLYEEAYGFTVLRFYSHGFTVYLGAVFALLAVKVLNEQSRESFLHHSFLASLGLLFAWNALNPHLRIAETNVRRHLEGRGQLDHAYLRGLSDDAIPAMVALASASPEAQRRSILLELDGRALALWKKADYAWPAYHFGEASALKSYAGLLGAPRGLQKEEQLQTLHIETEARARSARGG
ncbi:MAG: DUF4173 domain-containing protein [Elusimicrobia bacterium]|nr:DUF4173 domain-containing protein [Elusimicrobiota bacterium]